MSAPTSAARAGRADIALQAFIARAGCDCEESLAELLTDLMHWADRCRISFDEHLFLARYEHAKSLRKGGAA